MNAETLLLIIWISLMVFVVSSGVVTSILYRRLRDRHRETWMALGSPTLILNSSIANRRRVNQFLRRGEHRQLGDQTLDRLALAAKVLGGLSMVLFLAGFFMVLARQW
jgi:uncharacterized membrane protein YhaH (DUF805 family)